MNIARQEIVITGSNGFVGQSLIRFISELPENERPHKLTLIGRRDRPQQTITIKNTELIYIAADLTQPWKFRAANQVVINLAADGSKSAYSQESCIAFKKIGLNLVTWCLENHPKKVFHASSGACDGISLIDGNNSTLEISEFMGKKALFIESRLDVERLINDYAASTKTQYSIGRLFTFIGPELIKKEQYAISQFIACALNGLPIVVSGNPETSRSYLHESEMCEWIWKSIRIENIENVLKIGSSKAVTMKEVAEEISLLTGSSIEYMNKGRVGDKYIADNTETLGILGVQENIDWKASLREAIDSVKR
jgi:nucleoside-diphosphate-sugar epimerase